MSNSMSGKTLVISGGTKGIGKECVYKFASNGVNVAFTYNSNGEVALEICKDVEAKFGVKCRAYPFNILEPEFYKEQKFRNYLLNHLEKMIKFIEQVEKNLLFY